MGKETGVGALDPGMVLGQRIPPRAGPLARTHAWLTVIPTPHSPFPALREYLPPKGRA